MRAVLEPVGYSVIEAANGGEALERARDEHPDVILLDSMMPGHSGLYVLAELRHDPELGSTPVVMVSARTQTSDRDAATRAGADRFLAKPFSPDELVALLEELLETRP